MTRPYRARALAVVLVIAAAGCQDYNFNPVGHCVLQPGSQRFTLSNVSSADLLFVVDDSGSMAGKQDSLAAAFGDFVDNLTSTNRGRAASGLLPLDFHIAVTTTSVYFNRSDYGYQCLSGCSGAGSALACCMGTTAVFGPKPCTTPGTTDGCPAHGGDTTTCKLTCNGVLGEPYCCLADNTIPSWMLDADVGLGKLDTCTVENLPCGGLLTHYPWGSDFTNQCAAATKGIALPGLPYPDGAFVGSTDVGSLAVNPRVLHFDKRLYLTSVPVEANGRNAQGFSMDDLKRFFRENVHVGTCGSAQEQGLEASYRAVKLAVEGKQKDTYTYDYAAGLVAGSTAATTKQFTAPGGVPTPAATAVWPTPNAKLVVVYVGDEDDCSSPKDPSGGVVLTTTDESGADACVRDATAPAPLGGKETPVSFYTGYLGSLGRQVGAGFVVSARSAADPSSCSNDSCQADLCCDFACSATCPPPSGGVCGGQAAGTRFIEAAQTLKTGGTDVVVGSICGDYKPLLRGVAEIVKPPQTLALPTLPADSQITILRIATPDGLTRSICKRPLVPNAAYDLSSAQATGADWWFVASADAAPPYDPTGVATVATPTKFVYINPEGSCIANPGETYSADYLGMVPAGGCSVMPGDVQDVDGVPATTSDDRVLGSSDCQAKMGGQFSDWQCYVPPGLSTGTCTCRPTG